MRPTEPTYDHPTRGMQLRPASPHVEGQPVRISMCHCFECQRRTGAVLSNQARFAREQMTLSGTAMEWTRTAQAAMG